MVAVDVSCVLVTQGKCTSVLPSDLPSRAAEESYVYGERSAVNLPKLWTCEDSGNVEMSMP